MKKDIREFQIIKLIAIIGAWYLIYIKLQLAANFITYSMFGLSKTSHLAGALNFFVFETPKVLMLLIVVVFGVGIIRSFFTAEKTRLILAGKKEFIGNILAALLGIVTPFCSCSAVPLFIGFVQAGVPLGVTFSFLIAAPMINEVAVILLLGMFGWKVTAVYIGTGLIIAILAGWIIGRIKMEKYVEEWVYEVQAIGCCSQEEKLTWKDRTDFARNTVKEIVGKVWIYVVIGIAVGAGIHGYVPENFMASIMGKSAWWSVPAAVLIGVPMYSNAAGIIPIISALLGKGAALGTALAFMMSVIGLSLPEMIILRQVLKIRLILVFVGVVSFGILIVGYLFNLIF